MPDCASRIRLLTLVSRIGIGFCDFSTNHVHRADIRSIICRNEDISITKGAK